MPGRVDLGLGDGPGDAEVHDLDLAVAPDEHVPGLDVAMDDAACVGGREGSCDGGPDPGHLSRRQGAAASDDGGEVFPVDQLHDDVRAGRVLAVVVDRDDIGMRQRCGRLGLLPEPGREVRVLEVLRPQELDRHVATELRVGAAEDGRHPALPEELDQSISTAEDRPDLRHV